MQDAVLRLLAASVMTLVVSAAHPAPVANLPLTCSSAATLPQTDCSGAWTYQLPSSDQLIVLKVAGSVFTWNRAANLASNDLISVCSMPVEPGQYSACKDASGVRRIVYVPKSQVFTSAPPPPPAAGAQILDLSRAPVEITQSGTYVLDRSWLNLSTEGRPMISITASNVTLDLQGFEIRASLGAPGPASVISSTGVQATIRNGTVRLEQGTAIQATGGGTRIQNMWTVVGYGTAISVAGTNSIVSDSFALSDESGTAVLAGDGTIVRDNRIQSDYTAVRVGSRATVTDNAISRCVFEECIVVTGNDNIIGRNQFELIYAGGTGTALVIEGNHNVASENVFRSCGRGAAILVQGLGNTIRNNIVPKCDGGTAQWNTGIEFQRDGNFYGDNTIWALVPFNTGATVQTDLGGNIGLSN